MNKDKYVFSQLVTFLDEFKFLRIVKKYEGNKYIKSYTCWNQLLTMMFGQLSNRESLRDLIVSLEAHTGKLYHLGIGKLSYFPASSTSSQEMKAPTSNSRKGKNKSPFLIFINYKIFINYELQITNYKKQVAFTTHPRNL